MGFFFPVFELPAITLTQFNWGSLDELLITERGIVNDTM